MSPRPGERESARRGALVPARPGRMQRRSRYRQTCEAPESRRARFNVRHLQRSVMKAHSEGLARRRSERAVALEVKMAHLRPRSLLSAAPPSTIHLHHGVRV